MYGGDSLCDRSRLSYSYKISELIKSSFEDRYYLIYENIFDEFDGVGFIYPTISSIKYVSYDMYEIIAEAFDEKDQVSSNHVYSNAKAKLYKFLISIERNENGLKIGKIKSQKLLK